MKDIKKNNKLPPPEIKIELINKFEKGDLEELCDATELAVQEGGGFGWINPPPRKVLKDYWNGVLIMPERDLVIGRLDKIIAGSCQILKPSRNNEAQSHICNLTTFFLAPWARGYGVSPKLIEYAESYVQKKNFKIITLDVRETQLRAIEIYKKNGYQCFGANDYYANVNGKYIKGLYFYKNIS